MRREWNSFAREGVDMDMNDVAPSFNLIDEKWIPVAYLSGGYERRSLRDVFYRAHEIDSIAGELPQMAFAIMRLQEAILYRVCLDWQMESVIDWAALWSRGRFDTGAIDRYFEKWHASFDLFGDKPFLQTPGLSYSAKEPDSPSVIMPDLPTKRDKFLFSMRAPKEDFELEYDEAARYLIVAQLYDIAGIKSCVIGNTHINKGRVYAPKGAVGTGWCGAIGGVFVEGHNYFETLMLNLVLRTSRRSPSGLVGIEGDLPPWEKDASIADLRERNPRGPVDLLTWQSRRIRLVPDERRRKVTGVVLCYGDITTPLNKQGCEMMTSWRESKEQQKKLKLAAPPWMPQTHDPSKAIWRGFSSLLSYRDSIGGGTIDMRPGIIQWLELLEDEEIIEESRSFSIRSVGMSYGTQNSVYEDSIDDKIDLCGLLLRHDSEATGKCLEIIRLADEAVKEVVSFVWKMEKTAGDKRRYSSSSDAQATAVKNDVRERAYDELDSLFRDKIAHFTSEVDCVIYGAEWKAAIRKRLWRLSMEYVQAARASLFKENDGVILGRSIQWLKYRLFVLLGEEGDSFDSVGDVEMFG